MRWTVLFCNSFRNPVKIIQNYVKPIGTAIPVTFSDRIHISPGHSYARAITSSNYLSIVPLSASRCTPDKSFESKHSTIMDRWGEHLCYARYAIITVLAFWFLNVLVFGQNSARCPCLCPCLFPLTTGYKLPLAREKWLIVLGNQRFGSLHLFGGPLNAPSANDLPERLFD